MKNNIIIMIFIALVCAGSIWAIIYNFYMAWFKPYKFLEKASMGVKEWWPFAQYFRSYYASSKWLWITRISASFFLLVIIFLAYKIIFNQVNIMP